MGCCRARSAGPPIGDNHQPQIVGFGLRPAGPALGPTTRPSGASGPVRPVYAAAKSDLELLSGRRHLREDSDDSAPFTAVAARSGNWGEGGGRGVFSVEEGGREGEAEEGGEVVHNFPTAAGTATRLAPSPLQRWHLKHVWNLSKLWPRSDKDLIGRTGDFIAPLRSESAAVLLGRAGKLALPSQVLPTSPGPGPAVLARRRQSLDSGPGWAAHLLGSLFLTYSETWYTTDY